MLVSRFLMDYSVILPSYNEASNIGRSIDSVKIAAQKAEIACEIIVVDNCSTDDTVCIARNHGAVVLQNTCGQRHTIAHLRNMGAAMAKGRILAFLDSDMAVPDNWFVAAERIFQAGFTGLMGFAETVPEDAGWVAKAWGDMRFSGAAREVDFIDGRNMLIPRQLFVETGGFDDSLITCEDKEFGIRVKKCGWPVLRSPEAVLIHWGYERNLLEFIKKEFWRQSSSLYMINRLGVTLRTLRHPLLSLYHLIIPLIVIALFVNDLYWLAVCAFALWVLPSIIIALNKAMTGKSNALPFWFLTFMRWNISGLALLKQLFMGVSLVKKT